MRRSWQRIWHGLAARGDGADTFDELCRRHAEPHRSYHTLQHLAECLACFDGVRELAANAPEVEAALWFHDAIHDPGRKDNEARSAELARGLLHGAGVAAGRVAQIESLILATTHDAPADTPDQRLVVDIDLLILAAGPRRFAEYERQVRDEYRFVPEAVFREKRRALLESFFARPSIYGTERFRTALEQRARDNLQRARAALRTVELRPAGLADAPLLRHWDGQAHVIAAKSTDDWQWETELGHAFEWREQSIAELDGRPIGFVQIIDPAREDSHYWGEVAGGLRAIDIWIGEADALGRGYGTSMMRLALARCFADPSVAAVLIDPLAGNTRAHRFYERCGFRLVGPRRFGDDDCLVFRLDRQEWQENRERHERLGEGNCAP
ncbi:MAG TPA: GNAT family N-acetyltransferase [Burkholderiaceae bacterium]|nr:GNAT family N-acetyltransferase [Burkholderiaceae bacterium]